MKKKLIIGLFAITFYATSCGDQKQKMVADNSAVVTVSLNSVSQESSNSFLTTSGKIEAVNSANLSTRMMGYVDEIYVKVGEKVRKGQQLISISNTDLTAKLAQVNASVTEATAAYNNAEKDFNRFTSLFNENSASQKELDDITANYTMAKARLEGAKQMKNEVSAQFSYANIRAPFSGTVTNKFINVGDMANPGMPLLEVESPGKFQVLAMVPESEILQIKANTDVGVVLKSLGKTVQGKVVEVSTSAKNTGGQYMVKVVLDKTDATVMSGMYATVQFPTGPSKNSQVVMLPKDAIVTNGQLTGVYTVSQTNTALLRWLRLGRSIGDKIEVLSGLSSDEQYIVSAEGKLYNGAKINIQ
jgi:RND family efflux transporter MFP subunit